MATISGRKARVSVKPSTTEALVLEIGNWDIDLSANEVDTTAFGSEWAKSDVGMKKWTASISGSYDPTDTTGQEVLEDAFNDGSIIDHIKFYIKWAATGEVVYWAPDTVADAEAGCRVTSLKMSVDKSGVGQLSATFSGSGPIKKTTATLP